MHANYISTQIPQDTARMIFELSLLVSLWTCVLYSQLVSTVVLMVADMLNLTDASSMSTPVKRYARFQFAGSFLPLGSKVTSSIVSLVADVVGSIYSIGLGLILVSIFFSVLYIVFEYHRDTFVTVVAYWNDPVGPIVYQSFIAPLKLLSAIGTPFIAFFNWIWWMFTRVLHAVFFKNMIKSYELTVDLGTSLGQFTKSITESLVQYVTEASSECGDTCYEVGPKLFDFITPLTAFRGAVVAVLGFSDELCSILTPLMQTLLYPFLDINFARGMHNFLNSILFATVNMPIMTIQRCSAATPNGGFPSGGWDMAMCFPDIEPPFNLMTSGLRYFGLMLDNLVELVFFNMQRAVGLTVEECELYATPLAAANYSKQLMGGRTTVVGLTGDLYAVTDGVHAQYFSGSRAYESSTVVNVWPTEVDVSHGVAAVEYRAKYGVNRDDQADAKTSMLGCRCVDLSSNTGCCQ